VTSFFSFYTLFRIYSNCNDFISEIGKICLKNLVVDMHAPPLGKRAKSGQ